MVFFVRWCGFLLSVCGWVKWIVSSVFSWLWCSIGMCSVVFSFRCVWFVVLLRFMLCFLVRFFCVMLCLVCSLLDRVVLNDR